jgi:hypothetical protein
LEGVLIVLEDDAKGLLEGYPLGRLTRLSLAFGNAFTPSVEADRPHVTPDLAERVIRDPRLAGLLSLSLGFDRRGDIAARLAAVLADPSVMPRLRHLWLWGDLDADGPQAAGLRARFGRRLR